MFRKPFLPNSFSVIERIVLLLDSTAIVESAAINLCTLSSTMLIYITRNRISFTEILLTCTVLLPPMNFCLPTVYTGNIAFSKKCTYMDPVLHIIQEIAEVFKSEECLPLVRHSPTKDASIDVAPYPNPKSFVVMHSFIQVVSW